MTDGCTDHGEMLMDTSKTLTNFAHSACFIHITTPEEYVRHKWHKTRVLSFINFRQRSWLWNCSFLSILYISLCRVLPGWIFAGMYFLPLFLMLKQSTKTNFLNILTLQEALQATGHTWRYTGKCTKHMFVRLRIYGSFSTKRYLLVPFSCTSRHAVFFHCPQMEKALKLRLAMVLFKPPEPQGAGQSI